MTPTILLVPGLGNSESDHWQSHWAEQYGYPRVEQQDWDRPRCSDWVRELDKAVRQAGPGVVLVAHSLGCSTVGHWAEHFSTALIAGAMLVAPADTERADFPPEAIGFSPMPRRPLPFPSIVVASSNDEYVSQARAQVFAARWGSTLVDVGAVGHINVASGLGDWPAGHALLEQLLQRL